MKNRYQTGGPIDEMEEANNRPQIVSRRRPMTPMPSPNDESGKLQQAISSGSDFIGRPQDEGYRPNAGTASERATLEGAYDSGKITESGDQGFGGPGSSRVVKAAPKAMPSMPKPSARDTGSDMARMMNRGKSSEMPSGSPGRGKSAEMPADMTKMSANDRMKRSIETNLSSARKGSGSTDKRSVTDRIKASFGMKSGGMTASSRGDGIAQRGKTRGKMC
jgi:hypothetical protein